MLIRLQTWKLDLHFKRLVQGKYFYLLKSHWIFLFCATLFFLSNVFAIENKACLKVGEKTYFTSEIILLNKTLKMYFCDADKKKSNLFFYKKLDSFYQSYNDKKDPPAVNSLDLIKPLEWFALLLKISLQTNKLKSQFEISKIDKSCILNSDTNFAIEDALPWFIKLKDLEDDFRQKFSTNNKTDDENSIKTYILTIHSGTKHQIFL